MIAIPIALENKEFLYIDTEQSILCLDETREYCLLVEKAEFYNCKTTSKGPYVCRQSDAVICSEWQET